MRSAIVRRVALAFAAATFALAGAASADSHFYGNRGGSNYYRGGGPGYSNYGYRPAPPRFGYYGYHGGWGGGPGYRGGSGYHAPVYRGGSGFHGPVYRGGSR